MLHDLFHNRTTATIIAVACLILLVIVGIKIATVLTEKSNPFVAPRFKWVESREGTKMVPIDEEK